MRETHLTLPELALIAGTRAALGAGLALLLGDRLSPDGRRALGWGLILIGAATTIPLAAEVFGKSHPLLQGGHWEETEVAFARS
ncbi:hypothetical protein J0H58_06130 [bacterium]|nr:hypothetical protein [bacterium]